MLVPCEDKLLRAIAVDRPACRVSSHSRLPCDIERSLVNIFEQELALISKLEELRRELMHQCDFSAIHAFRSVDRFNDGHLNVDNLRSFLKASGHCASDGEIHQIIRRIDMDGDAKLSYEEFAEFLRSPCQPQTRQCKQPTHEAAADLEIVGKVAINRPILPLDEEDALVDGLRDFIYHEKEIETAKICLIQKEDFNLTDAFQIFDTTRCGFVSKAEINKGFQSLGVYPSQEELDYWFRRYDTDCNERIGFKEF